MLMICLELFYVDTGMCAESVVDLSRTPLDDVADDALVMIQNNHAREEANPLEIEEIKRCWKRYID